MNAVTTFTPPGNLPSSQCRTTLTGTFFCHTKQNGLTEVSLIFQCFLSRIRDRGLLKTRSCLITKNGVLRRHRRKICYRTDRLDSTNCTEVSRPNSRKVFDSPYTFRFSSTPMTRNPRQKRRPYHHPPRK